MSETVNVALGARSYDIRIGPGLIQRAGALLAPFARGALPVVTDDNLAPLHLERLKAALRLEGLEAKPIILPAGESTKSFAGLEALSRALLATGVERGGLIVAFGGGVVGDLVGLAAGLLKRGIAFAQLPTTLLAQVDSSVGGKTAIDVPEGKNLIGLFHQPSIVIADTEMLSTLPKRELLSGYAEVAKYGAMRDAKFFDWLEANGAKALAGDQAALTQMIAQCCRMKAAIVARDERESGERTLLNLGHTFGHALEAAAGYSDRLLHGEAVACGMVLAFRLSEGLGYSSAADTKRLTRHLKSVGLPTALADIPGTRPSPGAILGHMRYDKKAHEGALTFVLAKGLGQAFLARDVPEEAVVAVLSE